jgi:hypothetical protein
MRVRFIGLPDLALAVMDRSGPGFCYAWEFAEERWRPDPDQLAIVASMEHLYWTGDLRLPYEDRLPIMWSNARRFLSRAVRPILGGFTQIEPDSGYLTVIHRGSCLALCWSEEPLLLTHRRRPLLSDNRNVPPWWNVSV